jgi:excisionase family DNA binding protein
MNNNDSRPAETGRHPSPIPARTPRFHSVAAVARILGMSEVTLYRAIRAGQFPAVKVRGRYVIPARALDAMEDAAVGSGTMVDTANWPDAS